VTPRRGRRPEGTGRAHPGHPPATARALGWIAWEPTPPTDQEVATTTSELAERERSSYLFPRHPGEADRLDLQHHALREALGRNSLAPLPSPARVLDVGTGTGRWGFELCWEHPKALVGFDLVPGRAEHPAGYRHVRGNLLQGLPFRDDCFDLVHQRLMISGIPLGEWPRVVAELARVTRPGGWVELVEPMVKPERLGPTTQRLGDLLLRQVAALGLDTADTVFGSLDRYLREAGLEMVRREEVSLPIGEWGGRVGSFMLSDIRAVCTRLCEGLRSRRAISAEEAADLIRGSTREFEEYRTTWTVAIALGRKPSRSP